MHAAMATIDFTAATRLQPIPRCANATGADAQMAAHVIEIESANRARPAWFYIAMAAFSMLVAFVGFAPTYYLKLFHDAPALSTLVHVHGLVFTSWLLLFFVQTRLVARHRIDLHRRLGVFGAVLALAMTVIGTFTAIAAAAAGHAPNGIAPLMFLAIPLFAIALFVALVGAGLYARRRNSEVHKRLMLLATISLLSPPIARLPLESIHQYGVLAVFGLTDLILFTCIAIDTFRHRRLHPAMAWGGLVFLASQPLRLVVAHTQAWQESALWLTR
jgi:hypothetical protein